MAPSSRLNANLNSTPLQFPNVSPGQTVTAIKGKHKRPLPIEEEIDDNEETYRLKNGQRPFPSDREIAVQVQPKHNQEGQYLQEEQPVLAFNPTQSLEELEQYSHLLAIPDFQGFQPEFAYQQGIELYQQEPQFSPVTGSGAAENVISYHNFLPTPPQVALKPTPAAVYQPLIHELLPQPDCFEPAVHFSPSQRQPSTHTIQYYASRSARRNMTSNAAAAALSKPSPMSSSGYTLRQPSTDGGSRRKGSSGSSSRRPASPPRYEMMRLGGFTLEEACITLPADLDPQERNRRLDLIAGEVIYEEEHPPVLPPTKVQDLPDKKPPCEMPKLRSDMPRALYDDTEAEIRRLSEVNKRADQERNNMAAKKSRLLRVEALENMRLLLNAKAAECFWLRLQLVALTGGTEGGRRLPSVAWGGFDYVYTDGIGGIKTGNGEDEAAAAAAAVGFGGVGGHDGAGAGTGDRDDSAGIVPLPVKMAITAEMHARVNRHSQKLEDQRKARESSKRAIRTQERRRALEGGRR